MVVDVSEPSETEGDTRVVVRRRIVPVSSIWWPKSGSQHREHV